MRLQARGNAIQRSAVSASLRRTACLYVEKDTEDIGIRSACLKYPAGCIDGTGSHAVPNHAVKMTAKDDYPNDHDFYHRPQTTSSINVLLKQTSPQSRLN